jgi:hypothetical protein
MSSAKTITVNMTKDKETKNTHRYLADEEGAAVTQLYVQKHSASKLGDSVPERVTITVKAA